MTKADMEQAIRMVMSDTTLSPWEIRRAIYIAGMHAAADVAHDAAERQYSDYNAPMVDAAIRAAADELERA